MIQVDLTDTVRVVAAAVDSSNHSWFVGVRLEQAGTADSDRNHMCQLTVNWLAAVANRIRMDPGCKAHRSVDPHMLAAIGTADTSKTQQVQLMQRIAYSYC